MYLQMVNHTVRTKLDELKRIEIARLQDLVRAQIRSMSGMDLIENALYGGNMKTFNEFLSCVGFPWFEWFCVVASSHLVFLR